MRLDLLFGYFLFVLIYLLIFEHFLVYFWFNLKLFWLFLFGTQRLGTRNFRLVVHGTLKFNSFLTSYPTHSYPYHNLRTRESSCQKVKPHKKFNEELLYFRLLTRPFNSSTRPLDNYNSTIRPPVNKIAHSCILRFPVPSRQYENKN